MNSVLCYLDQTELDAFLQAVCEYFAPAGEHDPAMQAINMKMIATAIDLLVLRQKADELSITTSGQVPPDIYYSNDER